jgi:small-conductance mechanosensitive channel
MLDGVRLFEVAGVSAFPAEKRAQAIAGRIRDLASDPSFGISDLRVVNTQGLIQIQARDRLLVAAAENDAARERVMPEILARTYMLSITEAVGRYRQARTLQAVLRGTLRSAAATGVMLVLLLIVFRISRRLDRWYENRCMARIEELKIKSFELGKAGGLRAAVDTLRRVFRLLVVLFIVLSWLNYVLGQFVWTRPLARGVAGLVLDPLRTIIEGFIGAIPNLVFLAILVVIFRYVLKLARLFFAGVQEGTVRLTGFDPDWAQPTLQIIRILIVAFGLVVAYPYIPGSGTAAFKGVSIFVGVMFSLGSSTAISNLIAGYAIVYRRAFKVGDRIRIGESYGDVVGTNLMVTKLRSLKNEEMVVPNSQIVNSTVMNYSSIAREKGLILHTTVGIGYETPWRQVEAMLLAAADRTPELLREPKPFVRQKALGDFAVTYELNVFTDRPAEGPRLTSALHANILDVFNEHGVQIMTPAYEGDPEQAKIVPKDKWYLPPAPPPEGRPPA